METLVKCKECNQVFSNTKILANHVRWKHKDNSNYSATMSLTVNKRYDLTKGKLIDKTVICGCCETPFVVKEREFKSKSIYFCSRSCANTRIHSEQTKNKLSDSIRKLWKEDNGYADRVLNCRTSSFIFRSKGELEVLNWLKSEYPDSNWTSGGSISYMGERLVRDAYSIDLKICVEYDGIWHFKDIHGQLTQKTRKDTLLNDWCKENNYSMIRISEARFNKNKNECFGILKKTIDNKASGLILIY
jgi:uncharacterized C2H2 Zn-finger protein